MPWPSMAYVKPTRSRRSARLPPEAMPVNVDMSAVDPTPLNRWDGFSPTGPMLASFPTGVSGDNLPSFKNPDESLAADSPIMLLDIDTGERAPFFAEIDQNTMDPVKRDLIIRPLARLHPKSHYAVAIRNTVKAADGSDAAGLRRLRRAPRRQELRPPAVRRRSRSARRDVRRARRRRRRQEPSSCSRGTS